MENRPDGNRKRGPMRVADAQTGRPYRKSINPKLEKKNKNRTEKKGLNEQ
jgi:hypothetical protein